MPLEKIDIRSSKNKKRNLSSTSKSSSKVPKENSFNKHSSEDYAIVAAKNKALKDEKILLSEQSVVVSYKNGFNNSLKWTLSLLESKDFTRAQVIESLKGAFL